MKTVSGFSRSLAIAGFLATVLVGCGSSTPEAMVDSARSFSAKGDYKAAVIQLRNALQKKPEDGEARYLLGQALNEETDYVTAEKELRRALEYRYTQDAVYAALARSMLEQRKGKQLVAELGDKSLANPEAEASLKTELGLAYLSLSQLDAASDAFTAALKAKPEYPRARIGQAMLAVASKDAPGAMTIVDAVLARAPATAEALNLKADLLLAQNDPDGAMKMAEQAVHIQPNHFQARFALASLRIRQGKLDDAATDIAALRTAFPKELRVSYLEALLAFRKGDAAKARDAVQQVLKAAPDHAPSLFLAGVAEYKLKSFDRAAEHLRRVLNEYPRSTEVERLLISIHLDSGHPERAQGLVDAALARSPDNPPVLALAGATALAKNDLTKASHYYERAVALDRSSAATRTRLGQVRLALGDDDRALKDLESASVLDAAGYQPDLALIAAHLRRKEFDKALAAAAALERKQPNNPLTYNLKGVIYAAMGDRGNARTGFAKALELQYDYLPAVQNLAGLDIAEKNPGAARERFEAIVAKQPKNDEAMIGLARVQVATGAPPKDVLATLERAVAASPTSVAAKIALGEYQLRTGDVKSALAVLQGAQAANPNDARILELLGIAQQQAGENRQAIETYKKLVPLQPNSPGPLLRLAALLFAGKDFDATIQALQRALALNPGALNVRAELANVQAAAGKNEEALAAARAIQKEFPKDAAGFAVEGNVYFGQKRWDRAAGAYREALKRQPTAAVVTRLHLALENQGKSAEANSVTDTWMRDNPKEVVVRAYLGERALAASDFKGAAKLYKEILPLQPGNVVILNNLAWAAMEIKDPGALAYAEKAYALAPQNAAVLDTYGLILLRSGDAKRAVALLTTAVGGAPKDPALRLHLAKALIDTNDKAAARNEIDTLFRLDASAAQRAEAQGLLKAL